MTVFSVETSDLSTRYRVREFQDTVAVLCRLEFTPDDIEGFRSSTAIGLLPDAMLAWGKHSPCQARRTAELAEVSGDNVMIHAPRSGAFQMQQRGGAQIICRPGQIYIDPNEVEGHASFLDEMTEAFYISLPRRLVMGLRGVNDHLRTNVEMTPQWRLFLRYGEALFEDMAHLTPEQIALSSRHLQDLAISAFSAQDVGPLPGTMAARLRLIKDDIEELLHQHDLSPDLVAARHGVSARYLRMMFASEQTSFRAYVLERRLQRCHAALCAPGAPPTTIADIAGASGFVDLSWFNNSYRRRFGQTPRETRAEAMLSAPRRGQI